MPTRVLLVDDEPPILRSLTRLLSFEPYDIVTATTATTAVAELEKSEFSVVLSDFDLGGVDGVELLRDVRRLSPDTSRILFSGHIDVELLRRAVNGGEVYRFVTKPWDDDELLQAVRHGAERAHLLRRNRALAERAEEQNRQLKRFNAELEQMVSERTVALELRNRALSLSQDVLDGLPVAVVGIAPDGQVALANALARQIFPDLMPGEIPANSAAPLLAWLAWSQHAEQQNKQVVDGPAGAMRIEVMQLGQRGIIMTMIPLETTDKMAPTDGTNA
jgi:CheY-like chemotaxis protein